MRGNFDFEAVLAWAAGCASGAGDWLPSADHVTSLLRHDSHPLTWGAGKESALPLKQNATALPQENYGQRPKLTTLLNYKQAAPPSPAPPCQWECSKRAIAL
jgi:hypothetical protein